MLRLKFHKVEECRNKVIIQTHSNGDESASLVSRVHTLLIIMSLGVFLCFLESIKRNESRLRRQKLLLSQLALVTRTTTTKSRNEFDEIHHKLPKLKLGMKFPILFRLKCNSKSS